MWLEVIVRKTFNFVAVKTMLLKGVKHEKSRRKEQILQKKLFQCSSNEMTCPYGKHTMLVLNKVSKNNYALESWEST